MLPFLTCMWLNDTSIVVAGHNNKPYKFEYQSETLKLIKCYDEGQKNNKDDNEEISAMHKFKNLDSYAQTKRSATEVNSIHQNSIKYII